MSNSQIVPYGNASPSVETEIMAHTISHASASTSAPSATLPELVLTRARLTELSNELTKYHDLLKRYETSAKDGQQEVSMYFVHKGWTGEYAYLSKFVEHINRLENNLLDYGPATPANLGIEAGRANQLYGCLKGSIRALFTAMETN